MEMSIDKSSRRLTRFACFIRPLVFNLSDLYLIGVWQKMGTCGKDTTHVSVNCLQLLYTGASWARLVVT